MMDIHIMSAYEAIRHQPNKPTYAIRIFDSNDQYNISSMPLQDSPFFTIREYIFDDIKFSSYKTTKEREKIRRRITQKNLKFIDMDIATHIIDDFEKEGYDKQDLLVHCTFGLNRSAAVAVALNDIFEFGHDSDRLKRFNAYYGRDVYKMLMRAAYARFR